MNYETFYDIAEYGSANWKGNFTPKEIAMNAYDYLCEFEYSKANEEVTNIIKELTRLLALDGSEECKAWLYQIASKLNLIDMDYADYFETDEWLTDFV